MNRPESGPRALVKRTLHRITVREAMRRQVVALPEGARIDTAIRAMIKFKVNAVLISGESGEPMGVVSKTNVMGAYYAELGLDSGLEMIMTSPVIQTGPDDQLENALETMTRERLKRLYVNTPESPSPLGVLSYSDIVGTLYRFCRDCPMARSETADPSGELLQRLRVEEVMSPGVDRFRADESLAEVMEGLGEGGFGAVLITDRSGTPAGVISKSDLIMAYLRELPVWIEAGEIMARPVLTTPRDSFLDDSLREMIFRDIHRLFVSRPEADQGPGPGPVVGVLSLSDAARTRSGSCKACVVTRL